MSVCRFSWLAQERREWQAVRALKSFDTCRVERDGFYGDAKMGVKEGNYE